MSEPEVGVHSTTFHLELRNAFKNFSNPGGVHSMEWARSQDLTLSRFAVFITIGLFWRKTNNKPNILSKLGNFVYCTSRIPWCATILQSLVNYICILMPFLILILLNIEVELSFVMFSLIESSWLWTNFCHAIIMASLCMRKILTSTN